jgi:dimethylhistidine N-methyltransferase
VPLAEVSQPICPGPAPSAAPTTPAPKAGVARPASAADGPAALAAAAPPLGGADLAVALSAPPGARSIPVRFLYDARGSELYEQITQLDEYYPYREELALLQAHTEDIVAHIPRGAVVLELGCGDGSKTATLLRALVARDGAAAARFVGVDVSAEALRQARRNLRRLCPELPAGGMEFIEAEYAAGLAEARARHPDAPLVVLWLGSSVGNFEPADAAAFLADLRAAAGPRAALLLATDLWKEPETLRLAYDDPAGVTRAFIVNGMDHALRALGHPDAGAGEALWSYEATVNAGSRRVEMRVRARRAVRGLALGVDLAAGEAVLMEISRKFRPRDVRALAHAAGLCVHAAWASPAYRLALLLPPAEALRRAWADTDALFARLPDWTAQPIALRHPVGFYYGHLAAFAKRVMLPGGGGAAASPLDEALSRGIDPNVHDPRRCHAHPTPPPTWPARHELEAYVAAARPALLAAGTAAAGGSPAMRALGMALEHERMHQETLVYMMAAQRRADFAAAGGSARTTSDGASANGATASADGASADGVDASTGVAPFFFSRGCRYAATAGAPATPAAAPVRVPGGAVTLGLAAEDAAAPAPARAFVWDIEEGAPAPARVGALDVAPAPVSVAEFREFVMVGGYADAALWDAADFALLRVAARDMPSTWSGDAASGEIYVHAPEASHHWEAVASCPVYLSLAEARAFAAAHGARVMTEAEHQHLVAAAAVSGAPAAALRQLADGGWEWTTTALEPFPGYAPDPLYPEYSADFFDGEHCVLRGSGPYTHPSLRRESFRNWYQPAYAHVLAKFRLVRDA